MPLPYFGINVNAKLSVASNPHHERIMNVYVHFVKGTSGVSLRVRGWECIRVQWAEPKAGFPGQCISLAAVLPPRSLTMAWIGTQSFFLAGKPFLRCGNTRREAWSARFTSVRSDGYD